MTILSCLLRYAMLIRVTPPLLLALKSGLMLIRYCCRAANAHASPRLRDTAAHAAARRCHERHRRRVDAAMLLFSLLILLCHYGASYAMIPMPPYAMHTHSLSAAARYKIYIFTRTSL